MIRGYLCRSCNNREHHATGPVFDGYRQRPPAVILGLRGRYGSPAGNGGYWPDGDKSERWKTYLIEQAAAQFEEEEHSATELARIHYMASQLAEQATTERRRRAATRMAELAASRLAELESAHRRDG